jgi:hypothetical protein
MRPNLHKNTAVRSKNDFQSYDIRLFRELIADKILAEYNPIDLEGINAVKFMRRIDKKYTFHINYLEELLNRLSDDYMVLTIDGQRRMLYMTQYFDTPDKSLYMNHHNSKLNRFKVRKRKYAVSGTTFLEVKFKDNKKITQKSRVDSSPNLSVISIDEHDFLREKTGLSALQLEPCLFNQFNRVTLIDKDFTQRITIDTGVVFVYKDRDKRLENLVVMETKSSSDKVNRKIQYLLKEFGIYPDGFSKYCIGTAMLSQSVKKNAFKEKIRKVSVLELSD